MPEVNFDAALRESVSETLEKMFFISDLSEGDPGASPAGDEIRARVDFVGEPSGWLTLRASMESARSLAADFLGEDEESLADHQATEVMTELANIVCGAVLTRTESSCTFRLSSPRVLAQEDPAPEWGASAKFAVNLAKGRLAAFLTTEVAACFPCEKSAS